MTLRHDVTTRRQKCWRVVCVKTPSGCTVPSVYEEHTCSNICRGVALSPMKQWTILAGPEVQEFVFAIVFCGRCWKPEYFSLGRSAVHRTSAKPRVRISFHAEAAVRAGRWWVGAGWMQSYWALSE